MAESSCATLVLEVARLDTSLTMSICPEDELASTVRSYTQRTFPAREIDQLSQEVITALQTIPKKHPAESEVLPALKKTGRLLWDHLFAKNIKERLKESAGYNLTLLLDEQLIGIPWELLHDGEEFLCLKFNMGRLVKSKTSVSSPSYRGGRSLLKMLIIANPTDDLKSAYQEGLQIKKAFDSRRKEIAIDFKSTRVDTLYIKKNLRDYDLVHFAGHCEFEAAAPEQTGWILSDGIFTTRDIALLGEAASMPSLVFSNACHSAVIPELTDTLCEEKTYSLASAFLFSGVRHYIGAIWKIEDRVSLLFAQLFYSRLLKGDSVGESLRFSRMKLAQEYGVAALAWTSYILYGDPGFTLFRPKARQLMLPKNRIASFKKVRGRALWGVIILGVILYLSVSLPSINPTTYFIFNRSQRQFQQGKNEEAILVAGQLIQKEPMFLPAYPLLGEAYYRLGRKDLALKYYFDYVAYSERKKDKSNLAAAYSQLGWFYHNQGDYPRAFEFYTKALNISREAKDKLNEAVALRKLAVWHIDKDENDLALQLLMKSSEINREHRYSAAYRYNLACDYFDIGLVFINKNDYPAAKEFYTKSFQLFNKLKLKNELSDYYFNLGEIYVYQKEYRKALEYYLRGLKIDEAQGNKPSLANDYLMLGELYMDMDSLAQAEESFLKALAISKAINFNQELASSYYNLGHLYARQNHKNKAREYLREAQALYHSIDLQFYQKIKEEFAAMDNL